MVIIGIIAWLRGEPRWIGLVALYLGSLLLHEAGHALAAVLVGGRVRSLRLGIAGGSTRWEGAPSKRTYVLVTLAGPVTNAAAALIASRFDSFPNQLFAGFNAILAVGNLLPLPRGSDGALLLATLR